MRPRAGHAAEPLGVQPWKSDPVEFESQLGHLLALNSLEPQASAPSGIKYVKNRTNFGVTVNVREIMLLKLPPKTATHISAHLNIGGYRITMVTLTTVNH